MMKPALTGTLLALLLGAGLYGLWIFPKPADTPLGQQAVVITRDGAKIAYYQSGPDGPNVVLLASLGRSVSDFNRLVPKLNQAGFHTIAVDFRGVGASRLAPGQKKLTLFDLAGDIKTALKDSGAAETEPIFIIGHAFGNRVARAYATQNADRVKAIVLLAAGGSQKLRPGQRVPRAMRHSFEWTMFPPRRVAEIKYAFFADDNAVPGSWKRGWYKQAAELQIAAVRATPVAKWRAAGGRAPILVLQAAQDRIAPAELTSARLKADFPKRVTVVPIANAGHALLPEQPAIIAREVRRFLLAHR